MLTGGTEERKRWQHYTSQSCCSKAGNHGNIPDYDRRWGESWPTAPEQRCRGHTRLNGDSALEGCKRDHTTSVLWTEISYLCSNRKHVSNTSTTSVSWHYLQAESTTQLVSITDFSKTFSLQRTPHTSGEGKWKFLYSSKIWYTRKEKIRNKMKIPTL